MQGREHLGQFTRVDEAAKPREFVTLLDQLQFQAGERKRRTYNLMNIGSGDSVLDVGCGTGADVAALATIVGSSGRAVGLDHSKIMLAEARERAKNTHASVELKHGDARNLPFPDNTFDACRCERVIEHIPQPERAIAEMVRVLKPGGRLVAYEPDWGTTAIDSQSTELTQRIGAFVVASVENGWIGRQLRRHLRDAALEQIDIDADVWTLTDFELASRLMRLKETLEDASAASVVTEEEATHWLQSLQDAGSRGRFLGSLTFFYATGSKRSTGWQTFSIPYQQE